MSNSAPWPVFAGSYEVGDPQGPVAICTLTSEPLIQPLAHLPGVAITGKVYTANLGITRIVVNITANPAIRFLLICGKDSPLFHPGQSLVALVEHGMDDEHRIVGAIGYEPVLQTLAPERVERFRRQIEVIDWSGEEDARHLEQRIGELTARNLGRFSAEESADRAAGEERFVSIRPGGVRKPLQYDPKGYFVIALDREQEQIILRRYLPDHSPAHEMRGHAAESMLLGLLREELVTQLSHAGYLGGELAKAEAALRLGLRYDQDRPLKSQVASVSENAPTEPPQEVTAQDAISAQATRPSMSGIQPSLTWAELEATAPNTEVNIALAITDLPASDRLVGALLEADEAEPFSAFRRTSHRIQIQWTSVTKIVMGGSADLAIGALVRARGRLGEDHVIYAQGLAILTHVARIIE